MAVPRLSLPDHCPYPGDSWLLSSLLTPGRGKGALLLGTLRGSGRLPGPSLTQRERGSPGLTSRGPPGRPEIGLRSLLLRRRRVKGQASSRDGGPPQRRSPPPTTPRQERAEASRKWAGPLRRTSSDQAADWPEGRTLRPLREAGLRVTRGPGLVRSGDSGKAGPLLSRGAHCFLVTWLLQVSGAAPPGLGSFLREMSGL